MTRLVRRFAVVMALGCFLTASTFLTASRGAAQGAGGAQAAPARTAPTGAQKARARELYTKGQQLFRQGDFAAAQRSFEQAYVEVPNPVVLLSVAECQVRSEQFAAAVATYQQYLDDRKEAPDRAQVEAQIAKLKQKPAFLTVESTPAGALIYVDGADTGKLTPADLELPGGDHMIAVEIEGFQRAEQSVSLPIGARDSVRLALPEVAKPAEPVAVVPPKVEAGEERRHNMTPVWVATGVAGAGLLTGTILGSLALKESGDFDDKPTTKSADKGERLALFADVGFGVAVAGGVTALILYLTMDKQAGDESAPEAQAFSLSPAVSRSELGLSGNVRF